MWFLCSYRTRGRARTHLSNYTLRPWMECQQVGMVEIFIILFTFLTNAHKSDDYLNTFLPLDRQNSKQLCHIDLFFLLYLEHFEWDLPALCTNTHTHIRICAGKWVKAQWKYAVFITYVVANISNAPNCTDYKGKQLKRMTAGLQMIDENFFFGVISDSNDLNWLKIDENSWKLMKIC